MQLGQAEGVVHFTGSISTGKDYTASSLPSPIDCCGLSNCQGISTGGGGSGGTTTSNLIFLHLNGFQPPVPAVVTAPYEVVDLDTSNRWDWNGISFTPIIIA